MNSSAKQITAAQDSALIVVFRTFGNRKTGGSRKGQGAPVRKSFALDRSNGGNRPPLSRLLGTGGGRGGEVRIKLYLSLLWVLAKEPYSTVRPARFWASLIGLEDHYNKGARRIRSALGDLKEAQLIATKSSGGKTRITLLNDSGSGDKYTIPGLTGIGSDPSLAKAEPYFRVPETFWTNHWITRLSSAAITMFIILLAEGAFETKEHNSSSWFSPSKMSRRYSISNSTRKKGLKELELLGLVEATDTPLLEQSLAAIRKPRKVYQLDLDTLSRAA